MENMPGQATVKAKIPEKQGEVPSSREILKGDNGEEELTPLTPEQDILVEQGIPQVRLIAKRMLGKFPVHVFELGDFISWGVIGLIGAARLFDSQRQTQFKTFAEYKIRGAIRDGIRGMDKLERGHRKFVKRVEAAEKELRDTLLRDPSEEEIAEKLGLTLDDFRARRTKYGEVNEIHPILGPESQMSGAVADNDIEEVRFKQEKRMRDVLDEVMESLDARERQVILLSFFGEGKMGQREMASILGVHETRISQIKKKALEKLKKGLKRLNIFSAE